MGCHPQDHLSIMKMTWSNSHNRVQCTPEVTSTSWAPKCFKALLQIQQNNNECVQVNWRAHCHSLINSGCADRHWAYTVISLPENTLNGASCHMSTVTPQESLDLTNMWWQDKLMKAFLEIIPVIYWDNGKFTGDHDEDRVLSKPSNKQANHTWILA